MSDTNGPGKSRLDIIEEMIVRQERANEAAHERFEAEDKRLLTAQILMNGAMQKMNEAVERTSAAVEKTNEKVDLLVDRMITLELKMEETNGKLDALIVTVDGFIRRPPDSNLPATA